MVRHNNCSVASHGVRDTTFGRGILVAIGSKEEAAEYVEELKQEGREAHVFQLNNASPTEKPQVMHDLKSVMDSDQFQRAIAAAGVSGTERQARKWLNRKGAAYAHRHAGGAR